MQRLSSGSMLEEYSKRASGEKSQTDIPPPAQTAGETISTQTDLATEGTIFWSLRADLWRTTQQAYLPSPSVGGAVPWSAVFFETQHTAKARKWGYWAFCHQTRATSGQ